MLFSTWRLLTRRIRGQVWGVRLKGLARRRAAYFGNGFAHAIPKRARFRFRFRFRFLMENMGGREWGTSSSKY
jgi:hypothetical protein